LKLEEQKKEKEAKKQERKENKKEEKQPFISKRFPTFFKIHNKTNGHEPVISVPLEGEKVIKFDTDVENQYFDRVEEPGELQIALLDIKQNENGGGDQLGNGTTISSLLNVVKSSPNDGTIRISFNPTKEMKVGDEVRLKVSLTGTGELFEEILWLKVKDKELPNANAPKKKVKKTLGCQNLKK
jgi:hypothetical protein